MRHALTRRLPYTPEQLFDLVADVERYPEFVRWVSELRAYDRREEAAGITVMNAEARVGFAFVREKFATRVRLDSQGRLIEADLLSGPFRRLRCQWRFDPDPGGTLLRFEIDVEFGSRLLERLLAANSGLAIGKLIASFEARAKVLYG